MVKLSVVIPALNQEGPIGRAIQQFWMPEASARVEVIVADAGSQDGTCLVARLLADELVELQGPGEQWRLAAKNAGAAAARGDVILFIEPETRLLTPLVEVTQELQRLFGNGRRIACAVPGEQQGWLAVQRTAFLACGGFDEAREEAHGELLSRIEGHGIVEQIDALQITRVESPRAPELEELAA